MCLPVIWNVGLCRCLVYEHYPHCMVQHSLELRHLFLDAVCSSILVVIFASISVNAKFFVCCNLMSLSVYTFQRYTLFSDWQFFSQTLAQYSEKICTFQSPVTTVYIYAQIVSCDFIKGLAHFCADGGLWHESVH